MGKVRHPCRPGWMGDDDKARLQPVPPAYISRPHVLLGLGRETTETFWLLEQIHKKTHIKQAEDEVKSKC
jgi:hypothetical protein